MPGLTCPTFLLHTSLVMGLLMAANPVPGLAQLVGQEAELDRLEQHAEDSMANGDPDGAAINIGKAALMASVLAQENVDQNLKQLYQGAESLFRTQENAYRAFALFDRAGGQLLVSPVSARPWFLQSTRLTPLMSSSLAQPLLLSSLVRSNTNGSAWLLKNGSP